MYSRQLKKLSNTRLDDVLIDEGVLERSQVEDAQAESEMTGVPLSNILFERGEIDEWDLAKIVARNYSLPFVDVVTHTTPREVEALLDTDFCRQHLVAPFDVFGEFAAVAVCEMPSETLLDELERRCGAVPFLYVTLRSKLLACLEDRAATPAAAAVAGARPSPPRRPLPATSLDGLPAASMRLGFNMHSRSTSAPSKLVTKPRAARAMPAGEGSGPAATPPAAPAVPDGGAPKGEKSGKAAAWQSIFDLGDEATIG